MLSSPPPLLPPKLSCLSSLLVTILPWPILCSLRFGGSTTGAASFSCLAFSSSLALFLALSVGMVCRRDELFQHGAHGRGSSQR